MLMGRILNFVTSLGNTSIKVHEWNETDIQKARLPNSPDFYKLTKKQPDLSFNGWSLAHAVVKADYLDQRNLTLPGIGFLLQAASLINFSMCPIELKEGASKALNDVSLTSFAGRVAQGLAILYGHRLGLVFNAHLRSYVESLPIGSPGAIHKSEAMADFLFADNNKTVLVESKGSFSLRDNDPTAIKSVLKRALNEQIVPWMDYIQPPPENGYVVYSCFREGSWAPSTMSVVDPTGQDGDSAVFLFNTEQVMRQNYSAWLRAMGLPQIADRLLRTFEPAEVDAFIEQSFEIEFLIYPHDGREFAMWVEQNNGFRYFSKNVPVLGIDLSVLKAILTVIRIPGRTLAELLVNLPREGNIRQDSISIFPDGSILGLINYGNLRSKLVSL